ncbi:MAG: GGDEF domain-containing protein [Gallionellaceae bacterium]
MVLAKRVANGITHSDNYNNAKEAVAEEESLERKYRLEPSKEVRSKYDAASARLNRYLFEIALTGEPSDKQLSDEVMFNHSIYLQASTRMFEAVDSANWKLVQTIDTFEVDPSFEKIVTQIDRAAGLHRSKSLESVSAYLRIQSLLFGGLIATVAIILLMLLGFAWMFIREEKLVRSANENEYLSQHDPLTELPNRLLFTRFSEKVLKEKKGNSLVAVLLLDLDRFKEINDTYGHHIGDELLRQVASRLAAQINPSQMLARLSGDEFAVILPELKDRAIATQLATNIVSVIKESFNISDIDISIGVSVGISYAPEHGAVISELLKASDSAMYTAKKTRAGYAIYNRN